MEFNRLQEAWARQPDRPTSRTDDEMIRLVVARDRLFKVRATVRDFIELGTAVCMAAGFVWTATRAPVRWPWIAAAVVTSAVGGVFVRERLRHRPPAPQVPELHASLRRALEEADHQIRLLRSVVWWYLLPLGVVVVLILTGTLLGARTEMVPALWVSVRMTFVLPIAVVLLIVVGTFWLVWQLNRRAVRRHLLPHRNEVAGLIRQLAQNEGEDRQ